MLRAISQFVKGQRSDQDEPATESERNAATIREAYAAGALDAETRDYYVAKAQAGEDVYAYSSAAGWNLWLGYAIDNRTGYRGVRIPLDGQEGGAR